MVFTLLLLAQAGVPLTSGFLAKFYVIGAAVESDSYALALLAMLSAVVSAFLYLRIIVAMYMQAPDEAGADDTRARRVPVPLTAGLSLAVAVGFTLVVGLVPGAVVDFARDAVPVLVASE
jgi:NADH-quinone oxidoreductase subunit N